VPANKRGDTRSKNRGIGGSYQLASAGDDWAVPSGFGGAGGNSDPFYNMLRFNLDAIIQKLSDLLDTLNAMALKMGVARGDLGGSGGGGGGGDLLPPGASPEEQEARLRQIEQRESGGQNINNRTGPGGSPASSASGFYQMIDSTWLHAAHLAGINTQHYPRAIDAPWDIQHKAALALINEQGERPWISSAGHHLSHQPLGSDDMSPGFAGRAFGRQQHGGIIQNNNTNISVVAPSPASAGAQVAEHQIRIHEHHSRFTAGKLLA
jgi:hypothetical protein